MSNALAVIEKDVQSLINTEWGILKKYSTTTEQRALEVTRTAALAVLESQKLQDCLKTEKGRISFVHSLKYALRTGLSLNPQEGKAALIPYGGEVKYQIMKNGMIEIVMSVPNVKLLTAKTIFEKDKFRLWENEQGSHYELEPCLTNRGKSIGYLSVLVLQDGTASFDYMSVDQVEAHKKKYVKYNSDAWNNSFDGMGKKTVIKQHLRNTHISPQVSEAIGIDDQLEPELQSKEKSKIDELNEKLQKEYEAAIPVNSEIIETTLSQEDIKIIEEEERKEAEKE